MAGVRTALLRDRYRRPPAGGRTQGRCPACDPARRARRGPAPELADLDVDPVLCRGCEGLIVIDAEVRVALAASAPAPALQQHRCRPRHGLGAADARTKHPLLPFGARFRSREEHGRIVDAAGSAEHHNEGFVRVQRGVPRVGVHRAMGDSSDQHLVLVRHEPAALPHQGQPQCGTRGGQHDHLRPAVAAKLLDDGTHWWRRYDMGRVRRDGRRGEQFIVMPRHTSRLTLRGRLPELAFVVAGWDLRLSMQGHAAATIDTSKPAGHDAQDKRIGARS